MLEYAGANLAMNVLLSYRRMTQASAYILTEVENGIKC